MNPNDSTVHRYGPAPDQFAELRVPDGTGPHPVAVLLHGGFWRSPYDRTLMDPMAADLARRGWASWNVEYRRGAGAGTATLDDVTSALAALDEVPASLDHGRRVVIGHSAGGHLALVSASIAPAALVVSLAGVADLMTAARQHIGSDAVAEFIGGPPAARTEDYTRLDPMARIPTGARVLLVHGDRDDRVPFTQSQAYLAAAADVGDDCELLALPGVDHMAVIAPDSDAYAAWVQRLPR